MNALQVNDLKKSYRKGFIPKSVQILNGVSFSVPAGQITGFLGANGAGKTTTMKCVLGLSFPDSGDFSYFGGQQLNKDVRKKIGFLPERPYFYEYLTGIEFLRFYGELSTNFSRKVLDDRIRELLRRVDLTHAGDRKLRAYSKGMLQRVGLAQALIHDPEFVILDEPMAGLDPDGRLQLSELIRETAHKGTAVFFSSHLLNDAEKLCENLVIIKNGGIIFEGKTEKLMNETAVSVELTYLLNGHRKVVAVDSVDLMQAEIDKLRASGATIVELRQARRSLEEIFVNMAMRS